MKTNSLDKNDVEISAANSIKTKKYNSKEMIEGVQVIDLKQIPTEDGYFLELARLSNTNNLEALPAFNVEQVSYSNVDPGAIKAWHIHYKQDDIWFVPPQDKLLVGLHDLRKNSATCGKTTRLIMGCHKSLLLLIPRGVAHGCANISGQSTTLIYIVNSKFNLKNPDEHRLPWNFLGEDFWKIKKG